MPDWSYHPILKPLLGALSPPARARALNSAGAFSATRVGGLLVKGTSGPDSRLATNAIGLTFASPVGAGVTTPHLERLTPLVSRLGVGFVEVGPFELVAGTENLAEVRTTYLALVAHIPPDVRRGCRIILNGISESELETLLTDLAPAVEFFSVAAGASSDAWHEQLAMVTRVASRVGRPWLAAIQVAVAGHDFEERVDLAISSGAAGIVWGEPAAPDGAPARDALRALRARHPLATLVVQTRAETPGAAVALLDAGASLVCLGAGFAAAGPGLPKRVNETLAARLETPARENSWKSGWLGNFLLGLGMMFSGLLAWFVAMTRVVLPYDESFIGMTREELAAVNANMLDFLAHDRITLAGTMISIGILYARLAWNGQRHGARWAGWTITTSAAVGFASFFLFLGFGYFDPLHALNALVLLPFFAWGLRRDSTEPDTTLHEDARNDSAWRAAQWGQLGFVSIGVGLVLAGITIAIVGSTSVFVPQDLAFLDTTPQAIAEANARVIPLVAHDRAGFGGALVSEGIAVFLTALWGIRRGAQWVWWTLALSGAVGFAAAIGIHVHVGYLDVIHLAPVGVAVVLFMASLLALRPYLSRA